MTRQEFILNILGFISRCGAHGGDECRGRGGNEGPTVNKGKKRKVVVGCFKNFKKLCCGDTSRYTSYQNENNCAYPGYWSLYREETFVEETFSTRAWESVCREIDNLGPV